MCLPQTSKYINRELYVPAEVNDVLFFFAVYMFIFGSIHIFSGGIWLDVQASGTSAFAMQSCIESPRFVGLWGLLVHGGWVFSYILLGFLITLMAEVSISEPTSLRNMRNKNTKLTIPRTNCCPLKNGGWKMKCPFEMVPFWGTG